MDLTEAVAAIAAQGEYILNLEAERLEAQRVRYAAIEALTKIKAFRLRNLAATCPCIKAEEPNCDHGASADPIVSYCDAVLK